MKLVDIKEIAGILNVKPSTLYQWAELGHKYHVSSLMAV